MPPLQNPKTWREIENMKNINPDMNNEAKCKKVVRIDPLTGVEEECGSKKPCWFHEPSTAVLATNEANVEQRYCYHCSPETFSGTVEPCNCQCHEAKGEKEEIKQLLLLASNVLCEKFDKIESQDPDQSIEKWKSYKSIRNTIRDELRRVALSKGVDISQ